MNTATQAGVIASAGGALPSGGEYIWADVTQMTFAAAATDSPGTLARIDAIKNQRGPAPDFTAISGSVKAYAYGTIGGSSGPAYKWGPRNAGVGGSGQGPQRICPVPSVWSGNYTFFAHTEFASGSTTNLFILAKNASDYMRVVYVGSTLSHSRSQQSFSAYSVNMSPPITAAPGNWRSVAFGYDATSRNTQFYLDGAVASNGTSAGTANPTMDAASTETLSTTTAAPVLFNAFFAVYSRLLTPAEHGQLHAYALTLPKP